MVLFEIGSLPVYAYGAAIAASAALGWLLLRRLCVKSQLSGGTSTVMMLWMLPLALICARLAYCLVSLHRVSQQEAGFIFRLWEGGFMLYGAMAGCTLGIWFAARCTHQPFARLADAAAPAGALVICLARLAENLVGAGYGRNIADWFNPWMQQSSIAWSDPSALYRFPFAMQEYYGEWCFNIAMLEAAGALVLANMLVTPRKTAAGGRTVLFLLGYASMQALFESMRQDAVLKWGMIRVSQLLSGLVVLLALFLCLRRLRGQVSRGRAVTAFLSALLSAGIVIAMEFALEQKINFLTWMRMDVCYAVMTLACAGLFLSVWPLWRRAYALPAANVTSTN